MRCSVLFLLFSIFLKVAAYGQAPAPQGALSALECAALRREAATHKLSEAKQGAIAACGFQNSIEEQNDTWKVAPGVQVFSPKDKYDTLYGYVPYREPSTNKKEHQS